MGSEETRTEGSRAGSDEGTNVVRIPRDWFGPREELVPFGPSAWKDDEPEAPTAPETGGTLDAEAFWGEEAHSVHEVVDGRTAVAGRGSGRNVRRISLPAAVFVLLMAAAGLTTWLVGSSQRRPSHREIASVRSTPLAPSGRSLRTAANRLPRRNAVIRRGRAPASTHPLTPRRRAAPAQASQPTQVVVYHPVQAASTPPPGSAASASGGAATSAASASTTAQPASSSQASQPAFGASGALGPMSSPAG